MQAANAAKLKRNTFYRAKYNKLKFRLGHNKAKVAIANRIARVIYKTISGDQYKDIGYRRGDPHETKVRVLVNKLKALGVNIRHENHEMILSLKKLQVDETGVVIK